MDRLTEMKAQLRKVDMCKLGGMKNSHKIYWMKVMLKNWIVSDKIEYKTEY